MKTASMVVTAMLVAGCALPKPQESDLAWIAAGDRMRLQQPVTFPANVSRVHLQGAGVVSARDVTVWEPVCSLQLDHAFADGRTLPAQVLDVASVQRLEEDGSWERGVISYVTRILFTPDARPLRALECEVWAFGHDPSLHVDAAAFERATRGVLLLEHAAPR